MYPKNRNSIDIKCTLLMHTFENMYVYSTLLQIHKMLLTDTLIHLYKTHTYKKYNIQILFKKRKMQKSKAKISKSKNMKTV